jgi:hypothetical protein
MGGIATGRHAADFLNAGARAVAVGTESFRDPAAGRRIGAELSAADPNPAAPSAAELRVAAAPNAAEPGVAGSPNTAEPYAAAPNAAEP